MRYAAERPGACAPSRWSRPAGLIATGAVRAVLAPSAAARASAARAARCAARWSRRRRCASAGLRRRRRSVALDAALARELVEGAAHGRSTPAAGIEIVYAGLRDRLPPLTLPTLVVWGGRDQVVSPALCRAVARGALPDGRLLMLPEAGHVPMCEHAGRGGARRCSSFSEPPESRPRDWAYVAPGRVMEPSPDSAAPDGATPRGTRAAARAAGRHVGPRAGRVGGACWCSQTGWTRRAARRSCIARAAQRAGRAARDRVRSRRSHGGTGAASGATAQPDDRGEGASTRLARRRSPASDSSDAPARIASVERALLRARSTASRRLVARRRRPSRPRSSSAASQRRRRRRAALQVELRPAPTPSTARTPHARAPSPSIGTVVADRVPAARLLDRAALLGARASPQPRGRDDRRADRPRQPPQALRRHGARARHARPRRDARRRHLRSRRLQGLQRHVRPSGRRRAAGAARRAACRRGRRPRRRLPHRRRRVRRHARRPTRASTCWTRAGRARRARRRLRDRLLARLDAHPRRGHARAGAARRRPAALRQQALHARASRDRGEATRCCRCSPSRTRPSSPHLGHVAELAASTATGMRLSPERGRADPPRGRAARRRQGGDPRSDPRQARAARRRRSGRSSSATARSASASSPPRPTLGRSRPIVRAAPRARPTAPAIPTACGSRRFRSAPASSPSSTRSTR